MNKSSKYSDKKYSYPYSFLFPVNDLETNGQSYGAKTLEDLAIFWSELIGVIKFYLEYSLVISDTRQLNEVYLSLKEEIGAILNREDSGNLPQHCPKLRPLLDDYSDSPGEYIADLNTALFDFWEKILSVHRLKKVARLRVERQYEELFKAIDKTKRAYLLSFSKKSNKSTSTKNDRDLQLIWTGYEVVDAENTDVRITPRSKEDFPGKILSLCFKDYRSPQRTLSRTELAMSPKEIGAALKNIITSWSEKFKVSRSTINNIIYINKKDGSVHIKEALRFGTLKA